MGNFGHRRPLVRELEHEDQLVWLNHCNHPEVSIEQPPSRTKQGPILALPELLASS